MIERELKFNTNNSLLLFGARGTGKTTLIHSLFSREKVLWIDLLTSADEDVYRRNPDELSRQINQVAPKTVIIDEVQKIPKLLDIVHLEIKRHPDIQFILLGSSARKLKRGSGNLLAGRAFTFNLHPFSSFELGAAFQLDKVLRFGTLPKIYSLDHDLDKVRYLQSYVKTYLIEEILVEQIIRNADPFRDFLEVCAQMNGQIIVVAKIAKELGVDDKTVKSYFQIMVDTLMGFYLPPFNRSIRKRQRRAPKFYLFDPGVKSALDRTISNEILEKTQIFGDAFEHFVILECIRLNDYLETNYKFSYLRTKDDAEIDLVVERPNGTDILIELKSYTQTDDNDAMKVARFLDAWDRDVEGYIWSRDPHLKKIAGVICVDWQTGLKELFPERLF